uniref:Protein A47 n=1 Tax=Eptesipox virus TaxID=1329402 RepID=UPI0023BB1B61|nr:Chain A, Protein A47 [Eptesipox virus]
SNNAVTHVSANSIRQHILFNNFETLHKDIQSKIDLVNTFTPQTKNLIFRNLLIVITNSYHLQNLLDALEQLEPMYVTDAYSEAILNEIGLCDKGIPNLSSIHFMIYLVSGLTKLTTKQSKILMEIVTDAKIFCHHVNVLEYIIKKNVEKLETVTSTLLEKYTKLPLEVTLFKESGLKIQGNTYIWDPEHKKSICNLYTVIKIMSYIM